MLDDPDMYSFRSIYIYAFTDTSRKRGSDYCVWNDKYLYIVSIVFMRTYSSESTGTIKHNNSTAKNKKKNKDNIIGKFSN